ncbi:MAG TPA: vWA domain-containing protein [Lacipirellulaceae bacterium]|nr:vWA domain-containing protein [Lacipirellulaceae bacterium]
MALAAAAAIGLVAVVWYLYRRDTVELSRPVGVGIAALRLVALAGLFVFFLGIERRTTREIVHNSQVAVVIDASQSMGLSDNEDATAPTTRISEVTGALSDSPLISDLRKTHDVNVARFDEEVAPVVTLPKESSGQSPGDAPEAGTDSASADMNRSSLTGDGARIVPATIDWSTELQPRGAQTRLGQALADQLRLYRGAPLAGIIVISDGAQNAGIEPSSAVTTAKEAEVPIFTVGIGSTEARRNISLRDLVVPTRAFPGDTLNVTGYVQGTGYAGRLVRAELLRRGADDPAGSGSPVATEDVVIGADNDIVSVAFDLEPEEVGSFVYQLRLITPPDDGNARDNQREAEVDVVERKTRVLLFASGPMRDYQYLRNQLFRDRTMTVDVLLQIAQPGISQEANEILDRFPTTAEQLYQYDCLVAFDPDWTELDIEQVELLEKWISQEAGGMIAVAGPIHTSKWLPSTEHAKIRNLYPVVFQERLSLLDDGQYGGDTAWPLTILRAGREAKFLWLDNTAEESEEAWDSFPGVYGYYAVKGEKPGATVYARFSDPEAGLSNERPVYFASHFYGAGQVFYIGSGELWRLRSVDPSYFEVLYTKLIRHVSQGRILRGSARGTLLVERDRYELGETVVVRARLADAQHEPLMADSVNAQLIRPDGVTESIKLTAETERPGMYMGQANILQEGTYQVALNIPDSDEETLTRYLQVRVPDLERAHAQRNEKLLASLAEETGGTYYKDFHAAVNGDGELKPLKDAIKNRAEMKLLKDAPDQRFAELQMQWLLGVIAGSLFLEWIIRRLNRLA